MTDPVIAPRPSRAGIVITWAFSLVAAVLITLFAGSDDQQLWLAGAGGAAIIVAFAANMWQGGPDGFIIRVATSCVGGAVVFGIASLVISLGG